MCFLQLGTVSPSATQYQVHEEYVRRREGLTEYERSGEQRILEHGCQETQGGECAVVG